MLNSIKQVNRSKKKGRRITYIVCFVKIHVIYLLLAVLLGFDLFRYSLTVQDKYPLSQIVQSTELWNLVVTGLLTLRISKQQLNLKRKN